MKKNILILCLIQIMVITALGQTVIKMEKYNGVFRIPCSINGAKMKFIFDTGASNVCLSMAMAEYLYDNDYISKEDILGVGSSSVADGRIVNHVEINIKDIEIQGTHLYNVKAVVVEGQNAPLLMGQTAIQKLGAIEINGDMLIIKTGEISAEKDVDGLFDEANKAMDDGLYERAKTKFAQLYAMDELSDYGKYCYAQSCYYSDESSKAWDIICEITDYKYFEAEKIDIYRFMANVCFDLKKYSDASNYFILSSKKIQTTKEEWFLNARDAGIMCCFESNYEKGYSYLAEAAYWFADIHNVDFKYLKRDAINSLKKKETSYRNDDIDETMFHLYRCFEKTGRWTTSECYLELAAMARAGNKFAKKWCNDVMIDPYSAAWQP